MPRLSSATSDKQLSAQFASETAAASQSRLFKLVTLDVPDSDPVKIVDSNYDVTFGGETYAAFPVKMNSSQINTDGSIEKTSIIVANVSREMMTLVEQYNGFRNRRISVKTVYESALDFVYTPNSDGTVSSAINPKANSQAYIEDDYMVDTYTANEQAITFMLEPVIDLNIRIPRRRYMVDTCYWHYLDEATCKHDGSSGVYVNLVGGSAALTVGRSVSIDTTTNLDQIINAGMKLTSGTIFTVGSDPTQYVLTTVIEQRDSAGTTTGWKCTISPTPESSVTGILYFVTCNKTLADCKARNNVQNYGGFPGVSGSRRIML